MNWLLYTEKQLSDIITVSLKQTMGNSTEVEYISIYERPKRPLGRPRGSKYSEE